MLKEIVENLSKKNEEERKLSELQKKYQSYFDCMMQRYGVESPAELDKETMAKFFTEVSKYWDNGTGPTKDSPCK